MSNLSPIPAAQYLRASTDRQEYSAENQTEVMAKYAQNKGFIVVQTYDDPANTGVILRRRKGLQKLIQDVVQGRASYKAILVYDVTRWGRFQDVDESAYYEFLCKAAGVRVHYCAEAFTNDDSLPAMIVKSVKRAMAGEYSRELGVKVFAGQRRGASLGFRQGAQPGYGLRRLLVSADGSPKQVLLEGERKSISTDRVILVPGPKEEVRCVREIYRMFIQKRMTFSEILRELERRDVKYIEGSRWSFPAVQKILTHPKYVGCNVYGRFSQRLYTVPVPKPREEWIVTPGAFTALVDSKTFAKAQQIIERTSRKAPRNRSDNELLDALRAVLHKNGKLSYDLINASSGAPSTTTYRTRFGSVCRAYKLIGYAGFWHEGWLETRRRIQTLRNDLMTKIVSLGRTGVSIESRSSSHRTRLRSQNGRLISVLASRPVQGYKGAIRWILIPRPDERNLITLVARLNLQCDAFRDMFVIPPLGKSTGVYVKETDPRLQRGVRLCDLGEFSNAIEKVHRLSSPFWMSERESYVSFLPDMQSQL